MDRIVRTACLVPTLLLPWLTSGSAAALPQDQRIEYRIRETPSDPESDVLWKVELLAEADDVRGKYVGWLIASITITQFHENGDVWRVWQEAAPDVPTSDGLWWVQHADPNSPVAIDFALAPYLVGSAGPQTGTSDHLDYEFDGVPYEEPPGGAPFPDRTAAVTYAFVIATWPPIDSGTEEPAEVEIEDASA